MYVTPVLHVSLPTKRPLRRYLVFFHFSNPVQLSTVPTVQFSTMQYSTVQYLPFQVPFLSLGSLNLNLSLASPNEESLPPSPKRIKKNKTKKKAEVVKPNKKQKKKREEKKKEKRKKREKKKGLVQGLSAFEHTLISNYLIGNKCISDLEKYFWGIPRLAFTINFLRLSSNSDSFFSERSLVW